MKRLHISENRRFLIWDDGTPFFWLGDTAWELFHRTNIEEAEFYLEKRRQQGFTVLQAVVLAEFDGLTSPNAYGERPLINNDPLRPSEAYFKYVDQVIAMAAQKGLVIGLLPTWGDKIELLAHGKGPIIFNPENVRRYGEWIGRRYRDAWNMVWINGGDRQGGGSNHPIWEALARGIKSVDPNHLMTFHPLGGGGGHSSSEWFHQSDWLDFNLAQSGHERRHLANYEIVSRDYNLQPPKPCLEGEPRYEDHGVNWKPQELGWFDDYDVRQAAYWAVFAGAFGHTYGCHPVWQFLGDRFTPLTFARRHWRQALDLPGAGQMVHLRNLIESRPMLSRVPDQSILVEERSGAEHRRACRGNGYVFIYLPQGGSLEVNSAALEASRLRVWWFDPRTGTALDGGTLPSGPRLSFAAPWCGPCADWVLVLDGAARAFTPPGKTRPSLLPRPRTNSNSLTL
jgi:hypothetical protein